MPSRFETLYKFSRLTALTWTNFNVRFRDLDDRLNPLEALKVSWEEALRTVQDKVLTRSDQVIASLRDQLVGISQMEWLVAGSTSERTLVLGADLSFDILEEDRALFTPGAWSMLTRAGSADTFAVVRNVAFHRETGRYDVNVTTFSGPPGPYSDWQFAAIAGSTQAQQLLLAQGLAARALTDLAHDQVVAIQDDVTTKHADVVALAADATGAAGFDDRLDALESRGAQARREWFYRS